MDSRDALLRRLQLAGPEARTHGDKFEVIHLALAQLFGAEIAREVRESAPAVRPGSFNCLTADLLNLCDLSALTVERQTGLPYAQVLEQLGTFTIRRFFQSPLGRGLWLLASQEVDDILHRSLISLRSVYTHGNRRFEKVGPQSALIVFRDELMGPAWMHGIFRGGIEAQPQPLQFTLEGASAPGTSFTLRFTW